MIPITGIRKHLNRMLCFFIGHKFLRVDMSIYVAICIYCDKWEQIMNDEKDMEGMG